MQRRCAALVLTQVLVLLAAQNGYGQFSAFARITPETESRQHIYVQILPVEGQDDKCKIVPPIVSPLQRIYVIVCRETVTPEKQNFREYIWSGNRKRADVLSVTPLLPHE